MKFEAVTYLSALNETKVKQGVFVRMIPFNNGKIYQLNDSSFVILPLDPYSKALLVNDEVTLNELLHHNSFPTGDGESSMFYLNREALENLSRYGDSIIGELFKYLTDKGFTYDSSISTVDGIYDQLKAKRKLKQYRLNFTLLVAKAFIENSVRKMRIGLLRQKLRLTPRVSIVIVSEHYGEVRYLDVEEKIFGKFGFFGMKDLISSDGGFRKIDPIFDDLFNIFDWPG